jgi:hypothetical protein
LPDGVEFLASQSLAISLILNVPPLDVLRRQLGTVLLELDKVALISQRLLIEPVKTAMVPAAFLVVPKDRLLALIV